MKFVRRAKKYLREFGKMTPIALATTVLPICGSLTLLTVAIPLGYWLRENWEVGTAVFFLGTVLFCGLSLLPTNVIGVISGWAFSFELGITVLLAGIVAAATMSFFIHTRIVGDKLPQVFAAHPKAEAVYLALVGQEFWRTTLIIFLLRLSPAMPFALTNFLMASARVPVRAFVVGTFLGMLPRSSAVVYVGAGLSELNLNNPESSWLIIFGIIATIIAVVVVGKISKHALERLTQNSLKAAEQ